VPGFQIMRCLLTSGFQIKLAVYFSLCCYVACVDFLDPYKNMKTFPKFLGTHMSDCKSVS
jgi:hypothetical protein